jgi:hypothetical protein
MYPKTITVTAVLLLSLSGCGGGGSDDSTKNVDPNVVNPIDENGTETNTTGGTSVLASGYGFYGGALDGNIKIRPYYVSEWDSYDLSGALSALNDIDPFTPEVDESYEYVRATDAERIEIAVSNGVIGPQEISFPSWMVNNIYMYEVCFEGGDGIQTFAYDGGLQNRTMALRDDPIDLNGEYIEAIKGDLCIFTDKLDEININPVAALLAKAAKINANESAQAESHYRFMKLIEQDATGKVLSITGHTSSEFPASAGEASTTSADMVDAIGEGAGMDAFENEALLQFQIPAIDLIRTGYNLMVTQDSEIVDRSQSGLFPNTKMCEAVNTITGDAYQLECIEVESNRLAFGFTKQDSYTQDMSFVYTLVYSDKYGGYINYHNDETLWSHEVGAGGTLYDDLILGSQHSLDQAGWTTQEISAKYLDGNTRYYCTHSGNQVDCYYEPLFSTNFWFEQMNIDTSTDNGKSNTSFYSNFAFSEASTPAELRGKLYPVYGDCSKYWQDFGYTSESECNSVWQIDRVTVVKRSFTYGLR